MPPCTTRSQWVYARNGRRRRNKLNQACLSATKLAQDKLLVREDHTVDALKQGYVSVGSGARLWPGRHRGLDAI